MPVAAPVMLALLGALAIARGVDLILRPDEYQRLKLDTYQRWPWLGFLDPRRDWRRRPSYVRYTWWTGVVSVLVGSLMDYGALLLLLQGN